MFCDRLGYSNYHSHCVVDAAHTVHRHSCADQMDPTALSSPHPHPLLLQSVQMHLYHCLLSAEPYMDGSNPWSQFASSTTFPRLLRCLQAMCQQNQVRCPLPSTPLIRLLHLFLCRSTLLLHHQDHPLQTWTSSLQCWCQALPDSPQAFTPHINTRSPSSIGTASLLPLLYR